MNGPARYGRRIMQISSTSVLSLRVPVIVLFADCVVDASLGVGQT